MRATSLDLLEKRRRAVDRLRRAGSRSLGCAASAAAISAAPSSTPNRVVQDFSGTVDAVVDQNPRVEARDAIDRLIQAAGGRPQPNLPPIRIQAIF